MWTFLVLALVTSACCFQQFPDIREDDVLDQFVEEAAWERNHFRSLRNEAVPPAVKSSSNHVIPSYDQVRTPQRPVLNGTVSDSVQSGSYVAPAASAPPSGYATVPGKSGVDYPVLTEVPLTAFYCYNQQHPGYYADPEAGCQVFHVCNLDGRQDSFLCPPGTVFNQPYFVCDWWFNVDCGQATQYYALNGQLHSKVQRTLSGSHEGSNRRKGKQQAEAEEDDPRWRSRQ